MYNTQDTELLTPGQLFIFSFLKLLASPSPSPLLYFVLLDFCFYDFLNENLLFL